MMIQKKPVFRMIDLFAGAGGTSEGFRRACEARGVRFELTAINHWPQAIETHSANHPDARHFCESIFEVDPVKACPERRLDCLAASPECIYHSVARGGGPCDEQSRSGAQDVLRWLEAIDTRMVLIENVKEFTNWGPLYTSGKKKNRPIPSRKGLYFRRFLADLRSLGYAISWAVLNAADYGAFTSRQRFFLLATKDGAAIDWPTKTHAPEIAKDTFAEIWRSARDVIDWSIHGDSIFARQAGLIPDKKPLCENTIKRICYGLEKYSGIHMDPYIVMLYGQSKAKQIDLPLPTITNGNHLAVCTPYIVSNFRGKEHARSVDYPLPTIMARGTQHYLAEPFLVKYQGTNKTSDINKPLPTIKTSGNHAALCEPYLIKYHGGANAAKRCHGMDEPLPTVDTSNRFGMVEPFLVEYYGNSKTTSVDAPMPTVTTKDRFALVEGQGEGMQLDISYRMLEPHELARGMGFSDDYKFTGSKTDIKKQIGNAVEVHQAAALAGVIVAHCCGLLF